MGLFKILPFPKEQCRGKRIWPHITLKEHGWECQLMWYHFQKFSQSDFAGQELDGRPDYYEKSGWPRAISVRFAALQESGCWIVSILPIVSWMPQKVFKASVWTLQLQFRKEVLIDHKRYIHQKLAATIAMEWCSSGSPYIECMASPVAQDKSSASASWSNVPIKDSYDFGSLQEYAHVIVLRGSHWIYYIWMTEDIRIYVLSPVCRSGLKRDESRSKEPSIIVKRHKHAFSCCTYQDKENSSILSQISQAQKDKPPVICWCRHMFCSRRVPCTGVNWRITRQQTAMI